MGLVAEQPDIGRPVDKMEPEFREWLIPFGDSGYVALYRYDGVRAVVLAVAINVSWVSVMAPEWPAC